MMLLRILLVFACAHGTALAQGRSPEDAALHRALLGVWCNSDDGGRSCWAWDEFYADGTFEACGRTEDDPRPFRGGGRVDVTGRRMCYVVTFASENFWLRPGGRYCTDIVAIDDRMHQRAVDRAGKRQLAGSLGMRRQNPTPMLAGGRGPQARQQ